MWKKLQLFIIPAALVGVILFQWAYYARFITAPVIDGRYYRDWSTGFWLEKMSFIKEVSPLDSYGGVVAGVVERAGEKVPASWYTNHPQFLGLPLFVLTRLAGVHEWAPRVLSLLFFTGISVGVWFALRRNLGDRRALFLILFLNAFPLVVKYADKLDQEQVVLFFTVLALWGRELFLRKKNIAGQIITGVAFVCLPWSDWSGFLIGGALIAVSFLFLRYKNSEEQRWRWWALGAFIFGGLVVLVQSAIIFHGVGNMIAGYSGLLAYRGGATTAALTNKYWLVNQTKYVLTNFTIFGYAAIIILVWTCVAVIRKMKKFSTLNEEIPLELYMGGIALATFVYAFVVKQASNQMPYYQLPYILPFAFALVYLFGHWPRFKKLSTPKQVFLVLLLAGLFGWAGHVDLTDVRTISIGNELDARALEIVRTLPTDEKIGALDVAKFNAWFDNPNINYYTGRRIPIVPQKDAYDYKYIIAWKDGINPGIKEVVPKALSAKFVPMACGGWICVLQRQP